MIERPASAQSDQSLRCPLEEGLGPWLPIERTAKTDQIDQVNLSLRWSHLLFCWFFHVAAHLFLLGANHLMLKRSSFEKLSAFSLIHYYLIRL